MSDDSPVRRRTTKGRANDEKTQKSYQPYLDAEWGFTNHWYPALFSDELGEDDVEGDGGFSGTGDTGDHREGVLRHIHGDIAQVVFAGMADGDGLCLGCARLLSRDLVLRAPLGNFVLFSPVLFECASRMAVVEF